jgi:hypothetical protein
VDESLDFPSIRAELGLDPEPAIDATSVDVETIHLSRLESLDPQPLDEARLIALFRRAKRYHLSSILNRSAAALAERPNVYRQADRVTPLEVYSVLCHAAVDRNDLDEALRLLERGKQAEAADERGPNAPQWDMLEVVLHAVSEPYEKWVPLLAVVLERYRNHDDASGVILTSLVGMGLVQLVHDAEDPSRMYVNLRPLELLMERYGPRITTAGGELGVSAARGTIWTGETQAGKPSSGLWTPGSGEPASPTGKPKIIVPG